MIMGLISPKGEGKTVTMVKFMLEGVLKNRKIMANMYELEIPYQELHDDFFRNFSKYPINNCLLCIDEIHIFVDSRSAMSKRNKLLSYLFTQTRKRDTTLVYTTQFFHQIDRRLRDNTDIFIRCRKQIVKDKNGNELVYIYLICYSRITNQVTRFKFLANPLFKFYKTSEIINWDLDNEVENNVKNGKPKEEKTVST